MTAEIVINGLEAMQQYFDLLPDRAKTAARLAINQTADRKGLALIRENMRDEIAFPKGYLEDQKRLGVTKRAKDGDLEAIIRGRSRPTSLARFATSGIGGATAQGNKATRTTLRVNPNRTSILSRAFLVKLRAGQGGGETFNVGLAVRLGKDERIANKKQMVPFVAGLYLLYGPSVDQVFRTVAAEASPAIADELLAEFQRQFARLGREGR